MLDAKSLRNREILMKKLKKWLPKIQFKAEWGQGAGFVGVLEYRNYDVIMVWEL